MFYSILTLAIHHLWSRPLRTGLTVFGVGIGVSAAIAMSVANEEVFRSFETTVTSVVGTATIHITATEGLLDELVVIPVRKHQAVESASPVINLSAKVLLSENNPQSFRIQAVDVLEWLSADTLEFSSTDAEDSSLDYLLNPDVLFLHQDTAERLNLNVGDSLNLEVGSRRYEVTLGGVFVATNPGQTWDSFAIMDIAAAQMLFDLVGFVDRYDLKTQHHAPVQEIIQDLQRTLGPTISVGRPAQRNQQVERMLRSFQLNLTTLSMVGLFVGVFLVYNAVGFSVVQYRREIGILRALGMYRRQIAWLFLGEAAVVGLLGGAGGTALGVVFAKLLVVLESETVSELYTSVPVGAVEMTPALMAGGCVLGLGLAILGALGPCWEASHTEPARALAPGQYEDTRQNRYGLFTSLAVALFLVAFGLSMLPPVDGIPVYGYAAAFCLLLACTCLAPLCIQALRGIMSLPFKSALGLSAHLAADQIIRTPGRNSMTLSALMVGIAIMVGVGVMVQSFRTTVETWIDQTMMADLLITPQLDVLEASQAGKEAHFPEEILKAASALPGVVAVDPYRQVRIQVGETTVILVARDFRVHADRSQYLFVGGDSDTRLQEALKQNGVIVSEVLARRLNVEVGESLQLPTSQGSHGFPVVGIFYDYATDGGKVVMDRALYEEHWGDASASVLAIYKDPQTTSNELRTQLNSALTPLMPITIIGNQELREEILEIFDRTFRVTHGLELIAVLVGLLGIANTLLTAIVERQREFATFRALGAGVRQIQGMVFWESLILGAIGAILGLLAGLLLAALLIFVINKQSFGWTIQFVVSPSILLGAVTVAALAAIAAAYLPARWVTKGVIAEGLRYE
ncbi:FtsX-like permease family protein [Candidatus Nitronereus thalassa]|uniref:FtsX-like permease family protein n=1 Tax=Candidatus Nitronereus thalassa TaxID=3020898 RepID=A0ABU3KAL8_9BACT|nr:FtsX-like permease family protein [Candidatus Nitronereus thalassa]MDT7043466.1 FtsX-like permease family protein [Candidatus Nitronereus thalassa]